ncbi:cytochrome P450 CYP749A22-like [Impatiens glandulifera]|uniref:cytochrome P450 CYP749A22-like n=1 Tax=Impatiens glandulifera TaxID=253017 RepID=UPI001FB0A90D|nr:cytochrome P450 CYP749A22-like [Impatiens glandulifera]
MMEGVILYISLSLSTFFFLSLWALITFLHRIWWKPFHIQQKLHSQGLNGPPYKLLYGNTKDINKIICESMNKPLEQFTHQILPKIQPHIYEWLQIYGKNLLLWISYNPEIIVTEPELAKEILQNKDNDYPKRDGTSLLKKLFGDSIVASDGARWAKQRNLATHAFRTESLKNMFPAMVESAEVMLAKWKEHKDKEMEVFEEFRLLTSEVISRTAFGSSYMEGKQIFTMLIKLTSLAVANGYKQKLPFSGIFGRNKEEIEADDLKQGIKDSILQIVDRREKLMIESKDLLGLLLKAYRSEDESNRITLDDIVDECKTFYLTGHETTATLLSWTMFLLALHQDWQEKAREEVINVFAKDRPNPEGLSKLKTMNMIINECLRLYPPVISLQRKAKKEVHLGKILVPSESHLSVEMMAVHHDPDIWGEDVHMFKPERFAEGVAKATRNKVGTFIPFGFGPRMCVGMNFALNETKIALSMILQRYAFELSPTYVHSPIITITVRPQYGVPLLLYDL